MTPEPTPEPTPASLGDIWDIAFWQALSDEHTPLAGGIALRQPRAPLLLANAVWQPDADAVADIRAFYEPHNIHAGVVTTQLEPALTANLRGAGFVPEMRFYLSPISHTVSHTVSQAANQTGDTSPASQPAIHVEQVSWTEAGRMGGVLAMAYDYLTFDTALGMLVARAMQRLTELQAYLAFADDTPCGAMVVTPRAPASGAPASRAATLRALFLAGKPDAKDALAARLATEASHQHSSPEVLHYSPLQDGQLEPTNDTMTDLVYWRHPD